MAERGRSRLLGDAALSSVGMLLSGGAQFLLSVVVGRLLGPGTLGLVRGALSMANTASLLWPSAAGQAASLFVAREEGADRPEVADRVESHLVLRVLLAVAVLAPAAALTTVVLFGFGWWDAAWVAALVVALGAYHVARGIRFGRGEVAAATWAEATNALLSLGLLAFVVWWQAPGWLLAPLVIGNLVYAAGVWWQALRHPTRIDSELRRELDLFVLWGVAGTVASTGLLQMSMLIAKAISPDADAGLYAAAISLATPLSMVARALSMALFPEMARQLGRQDEAAARGIVDRATRGLIGLMTPGFMVLVIVAQPLVALVYGDGFGGSIVPLRVLLVAVLISTIPVAAINSINVRGRAGVRFSALLSWAGLLVGLGMIGLLSREFGIEGVAWGYLGGVSATAISAYLHVWRRDGQQWAMPTALAIAGVGAAVVLSDSGHVAQWPGALVSALLFVGMWFPLVLLASKARGASRGKV